MHYLLLVVSRIVTVAHAEILADHFLPHLPAQNLLLTAQYHVHLLCVFACSTQHIAAITP